MVSSGKGPLEEQGFYDAIQIMKISPKRLQVSHISLL